MKTPEQLRNRKKECEQMYFIAIEYFTRDGSVNKFAWRTFGESFIKKNNGNLTLLARGIVKGDRCVDLSKVSIKITAFNKV